MQNADLNEFDNQVRSLLSDARVEPSRRVWKAVSARLDADGAVPAKGTGNVSSAWYRWTGAALAFACIALGVFFIWSAPRDPSGRQKHAPVLASVTPQVMTGYPGPETTFAEYVSGGMLPMGVSASASAMLESAMAETLSGSGLVQARRSAGGPEISEIPSDPEMSSERTVRNTIPDVDPFAVLQAGDERARKRPNSPSVYAKGLVGGNNSDGMFRRMGTMMSPGESGPGISELSSSSYGVPLTVGIGVRLYFLPRVSVGTGVDYTLLTRTFTGEYNDQAGTFLHALQYVGIPVNLYFDVISSERIKFYLHAGGEVEWCVSNRYTLYSTPDVTLSEPVRKLQYSVGAGLGVEFTLTDRIGLFVDPGFQYYFFSSQPKSVRTERPLFVNFDTGLRFTF